MSRKRGGVYVISVVAELTGLHPQTLREYERRGLLLPSRTPGGNRRYSESDLRRLERILELAELGVNIAGIQIILALEEELAKQKRRSAPPDEPD